MNSSDLERFERIVMQVLSQYTPPEVIRVEPLSTRPNQYSTRTFGLQARADDGSSATAYVRMREGWGRRR